MSKSGWIFILWLIFAFISNGCNDSSTEKIRGHLIIIGGGSPRPALAMQKFVELAGGPQARIAIIPMASEIYRENGQNYQTEFQELGVKKARAFYIQNSQSANSDSTLDSLKSCTGFFFGGGDQNRLVTIFKHTRALQLLQQRYREGAIMGGTSAGAAIMSQIMITGEGNWNVLKKDSTYFDEGFGFISKAIIDQHFTQRERFNRLLTLVIQHRLVGIGIDERTAIWVKPTGEAEVIGECGVVVLDPHAAVYSHSEKWLSAKNIRLSIYTAGESFKINSH